MKEIELYIYHFLRCVNVFSGILTKKYGLECYPTYNEAGRLFPRIDSLFYNGNFFKYRFHGKGCTLEIDGVIIDYDLSILNQNKIELSSWKFYRFIETYSKGHSGILITELGQLFLQLVKTGALEQESPDSKVFLINEKYYEDYVPS